MAWKGKKRPGIWKKTADPPVDFLDLLPILVNAKLQSENFPLYQVLDQLIRKSNQSKDQINSTINSFFGKLTVNDDTNLQALLTAISNVNNILQDASFWTELDESLNLLSSRRVVAGTGITLDYTVPNEVIINSTGGSGGYIPLATGTEPLTFMSDGNGQPFLIPFVP
jgi:predicted glycosyltransferase